MYSCVLHSVHGKAQSQVRIHRRLTSQFIPSYINLTSGHSTVHILSWIFKRDSWRVWWGWWESDSWLKGGRFQAQLKTSQTPALQTDTRHEGSMQIIGYLDGHQVCFDVFHAVIGEGNIGCVRWRLAIQSKLDIHEDHCIPRWTSGM